MIVEEWQSGGGHCPQKRIGLDFEASSLSVAQLRLNADRGALTACSVGWYCEVLARYWRGALDAAVTSAKRTEVHGE